MKHIRNIILAVAALSCGVSCAGFLDENITTELSPSQLYTTKEALNADILGCYAKLASSGFKLGHFNEWLQPASGVLHWGGSYSTHIDDAKERWVSQLYFTHFASPNGQENYVTFKNLNQAAYIANAFLGSVGQSTVDPEFTAKIEGEAYFLRAMAYFWLVRLYGDVTASTEPPTSVSEIHKPRTNFWEVYNFILSDLEKAIAQMPSFDEMIEISGGNGDGRVCNYGAKAMRSLVYLTIGTLLEHPHDNFWLEEQRTPSFCTPDGEPIDAERAFRLALADAEDVIDNGPFELCPSYAKLFRWTEYEDWQLKERVFVMPTTAEGGNGGRLAIWGLPNNINNTASNSSAARTRPTRWLFQKWCGTYGGVKGTGKQNKNIYVKCGDPRMDASFYYGSYMGTNETKIYPTDKYIYGKSEGSSTNLKTFTVFGYKKYYDPTYDVSTGKADLYVMRFAEVYLIAAEAAAYLGMDAKAVDYVNVLLARARKSGDIDADGNITLNYEGTGNCTEPHDWNTGAFPSRDSLLTAIFWERCFELNCEEHEYFDTHRCGAQWIVDHICKPKNAFFDLPEQDAAYIKYHYGSTRAEEGSQTSADGSFRNNEYPAMVRKGLIFGYPNEELVYNKALDQNLHDPNYGQNPKELFWR